MTVENEEQQQEQETPPPTADTVASRDDLIAAVRAAGGTESVDVSAEEEAAKAKAEAAQKAAETAQAAVPPAGEPPVDPDEPPIAAKLRAREKEMADREAARNRSEEMLAQARAESERLVREARERADREWQAEMDRRRQAFLQSPTEQLRQLGDPQQIVDAVMRDGTPEARALRQIQQDLEATKQQAAQAEQVKKELEEMRAAQAREKHAELIARVRDTFMGQHATKEKTPYLYAAYEPEEIFDRADKLAAKWQQQGLRLGVDFAFEDVSTYLERETKKRFSASGLALPAQQSGAGAPAKEPGLAPKSAANGSRTLSAASGSERRTSPRPLTEMTPEEARKALIEEVAAARRSNPDAKM